jgi:hypothetical protein
MFFLLIIFVVFCFANETPVLLLNSNTDAVGKVDLSALGLKIIDHDKTIQEHHHYNKKAHHRLFRRVRRIERILFHSRFSRRLRKLERVFYHSRMLRRLRRVERKLEEHDYYH